jgi:hypothetical protein
MNNVVLSAVVIPLMMFCTLAYIGLVLYLINNYLPRNQTAAWVKLGRPLFQQPLFRAENMQEDLRKWLRTMQFILLGNQYTRLKDTKLTRLISSVRMLAMSLLVLWAMLLTFTFTHQH